MEDLPKKRSFWRIKDKNHLYSGARFECLGYIKSSSTELYMIVIQYIEGAENERAEKECLQMEKGYHHAKQFLTDFEQIDYNPKTFRYETLNE